MTEKKKIYIYININIFEIYFFIYFFILFIYLFFFIIIIFRYAIAYLRTGSYAPVETRSTCFLFLLENTTTRTRKTTC